MSGRLRAAFALVAVASAAATLGWWLHATPPLPPEVVRDEVVDDVVARFAATDVVAQDATDPVRRGEVEPADRLRVGGGSRPGIVAPPPARLRLRVPAPPASELRFAVCVAPSGAGADDAAAERSGVRFTVRVDGVERWARDVDPRARRADRAWLDAVVALGAHDDDADVELVTEPLRPGRPLAGTAAWGRVRVVRRTTVARQPASAGPNVLVVLVDTLRADGVGVGGAAPSPSPALDAFAARGRVFRHAVANASWTLPSVASLLSGLGPASHGAHGVRAGTADGLWGFLADDVTTWPELARAAGITTVGISTNPLVSPGTNLAQGFETFVELPWDARAHDWRAAGDVVDAFGDWLAGNRAWRFAAWLHFMDVHDPYTTPENVDVDGTPSPGLDPDVRAGRVLELDRRIGRGRRPRPAPDELAWLRALYQAQIRGWDGAFASLLRTLARAGVLDRTLVVVTADHGEAFGEHGSLRHATHLYDELLRVPLVLVGPGVEPGVETALVQGIDLAPTVLAALGIAPPPQMKGRDLRTAVARDDAAAIASTTMGRAPDGRPIELIALRTRAWKVIAAPALGRHELYDLAADPGEQRDAWPGSGDAATLAARLKQALAAAPPPPRASGVNVDVAAQLRSLGYVE